MKTDKKYGLVTATAMVVGSVIGSGVFFKTETLIRITNGNGKEALTAWIIGGIAMLLCLMSFVCVVRHGNIDSGLTGVAKSTVGENYAYYTGWFMATVYYPSLAGVLSWLSARYTLLAFGENNPESGLCMLLSCIYLIICFAQNLLLPKFSGKVQIITTVVKLIPLVLMIIVGILRGVENGLLSENISRSEIGESGGKTLFPAISAVLFAYEGWIAGLSINRELKNSKRNMPMALLLGGGIVVAVYIFYYMGIMGCVPSKMLAEQGNNGIKFAFTTLFSKYAAVFLIAFVAVSCYGALNGMMFSAGRVMYDLQKESKKLGESDLRAESFVEELVFSAIWLFLLFGFSISGKPLFCGFGFDASEIPVITVYTLYIPIFSAFLKKNKTTLSLKNKIIAVMGIFSSALMVICAFLAHRDDVTDYLLILSAIMLAGTVFREK